VPPEVAILAHISRLEQVNDAVKFIDSDTSSKTLEEVQIAVAAAKRAGRRRHLYPDGAEAGPRHGVRRACGKKRKRCCTDSIALAGTKLHKPDVRESAIRTANFAVAGIRPGIWGLRNAKGGFGRASC
jgi:hypothetical protein